MSLPTTIDLSMPAGDSRTLHIEVLDQDGAPFNLTDLTAATWILTKYLGDTAQVVKTLEDGQIRATQEGERWYIDVDVDPEDTEELEGTFYHECQITLNGTVVNTPFSGEFLLKKMGISAAGL